MKIIPIFNNFNLKSCMASNRAAVKAMLAASACCAIVSLASSCVKEDDMIKPKNLENPEKPKGIDVKIDEEDSKVYTYDVYV